MDWIEWPIRVGKSGVGLLGMMEAYRALKIWRSDEKRPKRRATLMDGESVSVRTEVLGRGQVKTLNERNILIKTLPGYQPLNDKELGQKGSG